MCERRMSPGDIRELKEFLENADKYDLAFLSVYPSDFEKLMVIRNLKASEKMVRHLQNEIVTSRKVSNDILQNQANSTSPFN